MGQPGTQHAGPSQSWVSGGWSVMQDHGSRAVEEDEDKDIESDTSEPCEPCRKS